MWNLYEETVKVLVENGKSLYDVTHVQGEDFYFSWSEFAELAKVSELDWKKGARYLPVDMVVVGDGFWLERDESDGDDSWSFKSAPKKPGKYKVPSRLLGLAYDKLSEIDDKNK